jgi:hypothetical protein
MMRIVKDAVKAAIIFASPVASLVAGLWNRLRQRGTPFLVVGGTAHTEYLLRELHARGHRVALLDPAPVRMHWRYATHTLFMNTFDLTQAPRGVALGKRVGASRALCQANDFLLPMVAAVNTGLHGAPLFSERAIRATQSKLALRQALEAECGPALYWNVYRAGVAERPEDGAPSRAVVKIDEGQGSRGVMLCKSHVEIRAAIDTLTLLEPGKPVIVEPWFEGRQFNVDAVISDGQVKLHQITEEAFDTYLPKLYPCWFIFGVTLPEAMEAAIIAATERTARACDFRFGAMHLEVKFASEDDPDVDPAVAWPIDTANRFGADFPSYADRAYGTDFVGDYLRAMAGVPLDSAPLIPRCPILRYTNFSWHPRQREIEALARQHAAETGLTLKKHYDHLIFTTPKGAGEAPLRAFLDAVRPLESASRERI